MLSLLPQSRAQQFLKDASLYCVFCPKMEVKWVGRNLAEPRRRRILMKQEAAARRFSKGGGLALAEFRAQWAVVAVAFRRGFHGCRSSRFPARDSFFHMRCLVSECGGWPWLAARLPPAARSLSPSTSKGREDRNEKACVEVKTGRWIPVTITGRTG